MDAWLEWAPRMRAAHAEVRDNMAALAVAIQRTGCDVAQARMSELERDTQPLAEEIIAAPPTSLAGLSHSLPKWDGRRSEPDRLRCGRKAAIAQRLSCPALALAHEQLGGYAIIECHSLAVGRF